MKKTIALLTGTALLATAAFAYAQERGEGRRDGHGPGMRMMEMLDSDDSGALSEDEYASRALGLGDIDAADADKDGTLTVDEIVAAQEKARAERRAQRIMRRYDIDGDGTITVEELKTHKKKQFALLDRDDDGSLSGEEARGMRGMMRGMMGGRGGHHGGEGMHRPWQHRFQ